MGAWTSLLLGTKARVGVVASWESRMRSQLDSRTKEGCLAAPGHVTGWGTFGVGQRQGSVQEAVLGQERELGPCHQGASVSPLPVGEGQPHVRGADLAHVSSSSPRCCVPCPGGSPTVN